VSRIRWTTTAADDFAHVVNRIREEKPTAAHRVAQTIFSRVELLQSLPHRGGFGRAENTRELVFPPWPYIVVYELIADQVQILRIRHASQDWP